MQDDPLAQRADRKHRGEGAAETQTDGRNINKCWVQRFMNAFLHSCHGFYTSTGLSYMSTTCENISMHMLTWLPTMVTLSLLLKQRLDRTRVENLTYVPEHEEWINKEINKHQIQILMHQKTAVLFSLEAVKGCLWLDSISWLQEFCIWCQESIIKHPHFH